MVKVFAPTGETVTFPWGSLGQGAASKLPLTLSSKGLRDVRTYGTWRIQVTAGTAACTVENPELFVEALGRVYDHLGRDLGQGLGAAMFSFTVIVDPSKLGTGFDLVGAELALWRMTPAHCGSGFLVPSDPSNVCPFPDVPTTIPDLSIPC